MINSPQRGAYRSPDGASVQATAETDSRTAPRMDERSRLECAATERALDCLQPGLTVGLGAGSTARFAIGRLAELIASARFTVLVSIPYPQEADCTCGPTEQPRELAARQDAIEAQWRIVEHALGDVTPLHLYDPGSWGPKEAERLLPASHGGWHKPLDSKRSS